MVSWIISRLVVLIFGTLYPAYYSYKAVKSKDIKEYVKWMMYWIIFALFTTAETFTDIFLCWFPFYYELKIAFVAWLLSPYTKGSSLLYRKFVHPTLSSKEKEIDDCLVQAKDRSYDALVHFGKRGLNVAATAAVMAASKVTPCQLGLWSGFSISLGKLRKGESTFKGVVHRSLSYFIYTCIGTRKKGRCGWGSPADTIAITDILGTCATACSESLQDGGCNMHADISASVEENC
ncbi:receptor expression-enhancing protein 1 isoform 3-T3 [Alca torda]